MSVHILAMRVVDAQYVDPTDPHHVPYARTEELPMWQGGYAGYYRDVSAAIDEDFSVIWRERGPEDVMLWRPRSFEDFEAWCREHMAEAEDSLAMWLGVVAIMRHNPEVWFYNSY